MADKREREGRTRDESDDGVAWLRMLLLVSHLKLVVKEFTYNNLVADKDGQIAI